MFFSFDGVDGAGKSTQMDLFCAWLRERGHDVLTCRDPGSTPLGEMLREVVLGNRSLEMDVRSEMLLYMAARAQLVAEVIRPALATNLVVVSDRFLLANIVYQGHAGGLDVEAVWRIGEVATGGCRPDLTFLLDMPVAAALNRIAREHDRMEARGAEYLERVRQGFLVEASRQPDVALINAADSVERVQRTIREKALTKLSAVSE